jgi:hypothetical protein
MVIFMCPVIDTYGLTTLTCNGESDLLFSRLIVIAIVGSNETGSTGWTSLLEPRLRRLTLLLSPPVFNRHRAGKPT